MIYFIRHGETDYNKQGRVQGWLDVPLNETGILQAEKASEKLKNYSFDLIVSSPLIRAKTTAEKINKYHNVEIKLDSRLREYNVGSRQGELFTEREKQFFIESLINPKEYGAETYDEFRDRVILAIKEIQNLNKNVLIVSHGGVYRVILRYLSNIENLEEKVVPLGNCEVFEVPKIY